MPLRTRLTRTRLNQIQRLSDSLRSLPPFDHTLFQDDKRNILRRSLRSLALWENTHRRNAELKVTLNDISDMLRLEVRTSRVQSYCWVQSLRKCCYSREFKELQASSLERLMLRCLSLLSDSKLMRMRSPATQTVFKAVHPKYDEVNGPQAQSCEGHFIVPSNSTA